MKPEQIAFKHRVAGVKADGELCRSIGLKMSPEKWIRRGLGERSRWSCDLVEINFTSESCMKLDAVVAKISDEITYAVLCWF